MIDDIDPKLIRKCEVMDQNGSQKIQFIAIGDRHKIMREDNGEINIIKLPEQGKEYRYKHPVSIDQALTILDGGHYETHAHIAQQIRSHLSL